MMTAAKLDANRRNAKLSTGPRSAAGLARSATNATTHGLLSRCTLLRNEDGAALDMLRDSLEQELQPATAMERMLTDHIIACMWRLRRVYMLESALVAETLHVAREAIERGRPFRLTGARVEPDDTNEAREQRSLGLAFMRSSDHLERLSRYEQNIDRSMRRSLADLRDLQRERAEREEYARDLQRELERRERAKTEPIEVEAVSNAVDDEEEDRS